MTHPETRLPTGGPTKPRRKAAGFWLWVIVACALQLSGWVAWFIVTAGQTVEEVPVATSESR